LVNIVEGYFHAIFHAPFNKRCCVISSKKTEQNYHYIPIASHDESNHSMSDVWNISWRLRSNDE
jgi:hypothetical protein